jgi:hypothetical protein
MVKPIKHSMKADETRRGASLQVMLLTYHLGCTVVFTEINCIPNHKRIFWAGKFASCKKFCFQYFSLIGSYREYNKTAVTLVTDNEKKINLASCKISDHVKLLVEIGGHGWQFSRNIGLNQLHRGKNNNFRRKLYNSILSKYRYTSLELVVRSVALAAGLRAKFRTCNPVRVTNSENNKEHCHNLWQCQTTVDS